MGARQPEQYEAATLFDLASRGDENAITRLLWMHYDRLANYIEPLIPAKLRRQIDADDLLQDTFTVAWQKLSVMRFCDERAFYGWLRTILRRKLLDRVRAANRQKRSLGEPNAGCNTTPATALLELIAADDRSPSSMVAGDEAELKLRIAIFELTERHRQVLELRFFQGLTVAIVAARMNCSAGAVHMLTGRAIAKLRRLLGNESRFFTVK